MPASLPLNAKELVRPMTFSSLNSDSAFRISSEMPSQKYSLSGSLLMLTKGSTAIEFGGRSPPGRTVPADDGESRGAVGARAPRYDPATNASMSAPSTTVPAAMPRQRLRPIDEPNRAQAE